MNWDDFRLVKAIAEARSLAGAADALDLNHSTVFRRLGQIETELGRPLFERWRTGYAPTADGDEMIALALRMADNIVDFERRLSGQDARPRGELKVTTTDSIYASLLAPLFASFHLAYPEIRTDVLLTSGALNLSRREADVAIRPTSQPPDTLVGRKVGPMHWGVYARVGSAFALADPLGPQADYISFAPPMDAIEPAVWIAANVAPGRIVARVNSMHAAAVSAAAGLGYAVLPCVVGDSLTGLRRMKVTVPSTYSLWLLTHPDLKNAARVRVFMDHMWTQLTRERARLVGD